MSEVPQRNREVVVFAVALLAVTLLLYARTATYPFIVFDDPGYVYENGHVRAGLTLDGVHWAFTTRERSNWHPLTWLSHMTDVSLFGLWAGGHHLVNTVLHALTCVLIFAWLRRSAGRVGPSAFVAMVFAAHPLHVESVAWISERKDLLCAFFFMLALIAHTRYTERRTALRYAATTLCFALALLAKPMAVTWPFVVVMWEWTRTYTDEHCPTRTGEDGGDAAARLLEKVPWFGLSALSCVVTLQVQSAGKAVQSLEAIPIGLRVQNAIVSYAAYLGKTFAPVHLGIFYPYPKDGYSGWVVVVSALILASVSVLALLQFRRNRYVLIGWLWFAGMLVPVIGLVQVGGQAMADRYMYLPMIGLLVSATFAVADKRLPRALLRGGACIAVIALSLSAWFQLGYWRDSVTLFTHTLAAAGESGEAHTLLAYAYQRDGNLEEALAHYALACDLQPNQIVAINNIAAIYLMQGRGHEAEVQARKAINTDHEYGPAYLNLGDALALQGRRVEAVSQYATAAYVQPDLLRAHEKLGETQLLLDHPKEAAAAYAAATQLAPDKAINWANLGVAKSALGQFGEAQSVLKKALSLDPHNAYARYYLALALRLTGDRPAAIAELQKLVAEHPDNTEGVALLDQLQHEAAAPVK